MALRSSVIAFEATKSLGINRKDLFFGHFTKEVVVLRLCHTDAVAKFSELTSQNRADICFKRGTVFSLLSSTQKSATICAIFI